MWGLDMILHMQPWASGSVEYLLITICVFSKWVEVCMLVQLTSQEVLDWFDWKIVCWFGVLLLVHTDHIVDFRGVFVANLDR